MLVFEVRNSLLRNCDPGYPSEVCEEVYEIVVAADPSPLRDALLAAFKVRSGNSTDELRQIAKLVGFSF